MGEVGFSLRKLSPWAWREEASATKRVPKVMIPVKILCGCGQKYAFEVEPVNGQMPTAVACPACGADGTAAANQIIAATTPAPPIPVVARLRPTAPPPRVEVPQPVTRAAPAPAPQMRVPPLPAAQPPASEGNIGLGILGALLGAAVGVGVMYGFFEVVGFRFPLLGVAIGALTGLGARILYKGTDTSLGVIAGVVSLVAVVGALVLMYGSFPFVSIISVAISVSVGYRVASG